MKTPLSRLTSLLFNSSSTNNLPSQIVWAGLRLVAGIVMVHNGLDKLSDIEGFATAYVEVIGLPFPIFFSYLAALTELAGAPLLALGLFTRPAALGLTSTMLVAIYHHILVAGFNIPYIELSSLYAACFAFFVVNGGGQFSLDHLLGKVLLPKAEPVAVAPTPEPELVAAGQTRENSTWGSYLR
ncbi:MAG: DoxX family protein [Pseudanabaenaceae cyanobacterium bins.68]|nr:DoxX family protein [Pseudanabaenaceae cyanobacterium bins.68]